MKRKIIKVTIIILVLIMLVPLPLRYKDGGTVEYRAVLYSITNYHAMRDAAVGGYETGIAIKVLGITIYKNTTSHTAVLFPPHAYNGRH